MPPALSQQSLTITLDNGTEACEANLIGIETDPLSGDVIAHVSSFGTCDTVGYSPIINLFTVDGGLNTSVGAGTDVAVAWSSGNTVKCQASGTLPSWSARGTDLSPNGSFLASTSGLFENDWILSLKCVGPKGSIQVNPPRIVTISPPPPDGGGGTQCSDFPPPPNVVRASGIVVNRADDATQFASVFGGVFPGTGTSEQIRISSGSFVVRMWSVSVCPGDFRADGKDAGCAKGGHRL